jgi:uncharacterized protein
MKTRAFDPRRLDVAAFAQAGAVLGGEAALPAWPRLADGGVAAGDAGVPPVRWSAQGLWRQPAGRPAEIRLRLQAEAEIWLTCQRCLEPARHRLQVDRVLRFVAGEDEAARLDEEGEEDVLALPRVLDLLELIEDELILELPIVPRHDRCPVDLAGAAAAEPLAEPPPAPAPHPFAALAAWKPPTGGKQT